VDRSRLWYLTVGLIPLALSACDIAPEHPALRHASLPSVIPAHRFAYRGDVDSAYLLSPDGRKLSWFGPSFGLGMLHVRDNATGEIHKYRVGAAGATWTRNGRWMLFLADPEGADNYHVYGLDTDDPAAQAVDLTPYPGIRAGIQQLVATDPGAVLVFHNRRDRKLFDLYRIDLATRRETLVARNPGDAVAPITAADGSFKGWTRSRAAQRLAEGARKPLSARRPVLITKPDETFRRLGASADRSLLWALSDRGRDRVALVAADPLFGWEKVLFEDPHVDVSDAIISNVTHAPLIAHAYPGYPRFEILDAALREDLEPLLKAQTGPFGLEIVSRDDAEKRLIVLIYTSARRSYYLVDRLARSYVLLGESIAQDLARALVPMQPVTMTSRDGFELHGYLTLPSGVRREPLPMVLFVHGGPWARTHWGDPVGSDDAAYAQFLANRGYAVLQVDFRGSNGYGRRFKTAATGEFARRMHEDLLDAVRWAIDGGIADAARIAIMGWSYGGYAALVGLTMTPEVFACGVSLNGPTDLASLVESFPPYATVDLSSWHDYVGDPAIPEDREQMNSKSPLYHAQHLKRPVLIVHGGNDLRVRIDQAERMVDALRRAGKPVEYMPVPGMSHGLGYWVHRRAVLRRTEDFLQRCLGGRARRFDPYDAVVWAWTRIKHDPLPSARDNGRAGNSKRQE
jgi:dipeptidyl aminopeptidase/acylaminoacyl peptidase